MFVSPFAFVFFSGHFFVPCKLISLVRFSWILLSIFFINEGKLFQLSVSLCLWRVPVSLCCKTKTKKKQKMSRIFSSIEQPSLVIFEIISHYNGIVTERTSQFVTICRLLRAFFVVSLSVLPWSVSLVVYFYQLCLFRVIRWLVLLVEPCLIFSNASTAIWNPIISCVYSLEQSYKNKTLEDE